MSYISLDVVFKLNAHSGTLLGSTTIDHIIPLIALLRQEMPLSMTHTLPRRFADMVSMPRTLIATNLVSSDMFFNAIPTMSVLFCLSLTLPYSCMPTRTFRGKRSIVSWCSCLTTLTSRATIFPPLSINTAVRELLLPGYEPPLSPISESEDEGDYTPPHVEQSIGCHPIRTDFDIAHTDHVKDPLRGATMEERFNWTEPKREVVASLRSVESVHEFEDKVDILSPYKALQLIRNH